MPPQSGAKHAFYHGIVKNQQGSATELLQTKASAKHALQNSGMSMNILTKWREWWSAAKAKRRRRRIGITQDEPVDLSALVQAVQVAQNSLAFIRKFNSEMFFQHLSLNGTKLNRDTAEGMYGGDRFYDIADLRDKDRRYYFLCLYAVAHKHLSLRDVFTLDGVFSFQQNRSTDEAKRLAGAEVFALFAGHDRKEIARAIAVMGECFVALPPLQPQYKAEYVKEYYTVADGYAGMGEALARLPFVPDSVRRAARKTARLREYLSWLDDPPDFLVEKANLPESSRSTGAAESPESPESKNSSGQSDRQELTPPDHRE
jgi:hypothetical protein